MVCLDVETPTAEILPALREHLHSRVPVYEGAIDVIVGILYAKDLLPFMQALGAYGFLSVVKGKKYFLKHVPEALRLLKEDAAAVRQEYPELARLVASL